MGQLLQKEKNVHMKNTEQSCIKFKKFNSSSLNSEVHSSSVHWTKTELLLNSPMNFFLTDKVSSERVECTYFIKGRNYRIMCVMKRKKAQFLLFSTRGHSSLSKLTLFILSSKKFNGELRGSSSSSSNELSLNRPLSSRKKLNLIESFNIVLNCYTALTLNI